jgi:hypothetical protein
MPYNDGPCTLLLQPHEFPRIKALGSSVNRGNLPIPLGASSLG